MSAWLVQILLPLFDNAGNPFDRSTYTVVRRELTDAFGGVTAHLQAPAEGLWEDEEGHIRRDRVVILEVMTPQVDRDWWSRYRADLEARFRQDVIVVRSTPATIL